MSKASATRRKRGSLGRKHSSAEGAVSKAQAIRDTAKKLGPKVRPKEIISALASEGIIVSSPQVSATLKAAGYRRNRRGGRKAGSSTTANRSIEVSLDHLLAAKALATKLGSVEAAKKAIEVLTKLA